MTDVEKLDWVWNGVLPKRALRKHKDALADLRTLLEVNGGKIASALLSDVNGSWTEEEMEQLLDSLMRSSSLGHRILLLTGLLRTVVQRWLQQNGADLPLPNIVSPTKRAKNPRRNGLVPALREHSILRKALSAANHAQSLNAAVRVPDPLALAVASSITSLRSLHPDTVFSIIEACAFPRESFFLVGNEIAMWQSLPVNGVPNAEGRVVVLDQLTALLLMRVSSSEAQALLDIGESSSGSLGKRRDAVLRELSERIHRALVQGTPTHKHRSILQMIGTCEVAADRYLPRCIISYLTRKYISASTPPETIARIEPTTVLLSLAPSTDSRQPAGSLKNSTSKIAEGRDEEPEFVPLPAWAVELFDAIMGANLRAIRGELARWKSLPDIPPIGRYLAEFGLDLAEPLGSKTLDARTVRTYLDLLFRFLAPGFEEHDPVTIGQEGADDLYEDIWNDFVHSSSGHSRPSQSRFAILLLGFHGFLVDNHEVKRLEDFSPLITCARKIYANIVSLEELSALKKAIADSSSFTDEQAVLAQHVAYLGWSTLRRAEASGLTPEDIDTQSIKVRKNRFRGTKTCSSTRCFPTAMVPDEEGQELLALASDGKTKKQDSLFRSPLDGFPDDEPLFVELVRLLKKTCDDDTLRFHTLRHSAVSFVVLALLCSESDSLTQLLPSCQDSVGYIGHGSAIRMAIYGSEEVHWCDLQAAALLAGHSSAKATTLPVYTATLWLAHAALLMDHAELAPDKRDLVLVSGRAEKTSYRLLTEKRLLKRIFEDRFEVEIEETAAARRALKSKKLPLNSNRKEFSKAEIELDLAADLVSGEHLAGSSDELDADAALREELRGLLSVLVAGESEED